MVTVSLASLAESQGCAPLRQNETSVPPVRVAPSERPHASGPVQTRVPPVRKPPPPARRALPAPPPPGPRSDAPTSSTRPLSAPRLVFRVL